MALETLAKYPGLPLQIIPGLIVFKGQVKFLLVGLYYFNSDKASDT